MYCCSDAACLCLWYDWNVHFVNTLARRHSRTLLCERCSSQQPVIGCDWEGMMMSFLIWPFLINCINCIWYSIQSKLFDFDFSITYCTFNWGCQTSMLPKKMRRGKTDIFRVRVKNIYPSHKKWGQSRKSPWTSNFLGLTIIKIVWKTYLRKKLQNNKTIKKNRLKTLSRPTKKK